jgi:diaminopimelate decarboxylase
MAATGTTSPPTGLSPALPLGSRLNERGRLEVGGCDTVELAREHGTPAYVVAEEDLRARAQAFVQAGRRAGHEDYRVVFAAKAFPCTAVLSLFAQEGLWCDVASGGELQLALNAGFAPERIVLHGNAKSEEELRMALEHGVGLIVIDNFDEIDRLQALMTGPPVGRSSIDRPRTPHAASAGAAHVPPRPSAHAPTGQHQPDREQVAQAEGRARREAQDVLIRVTPDVRGDTHEKISTGQADSKFGFAMADAPAAIARVRAVAGLRLRGLHAHIGSQLLELEPFRREVAELAGLGEFPVWDLGGGLGVRYTADQPEPPSIDAYVGALTSAAGEHGMAAPGRRLLIEPGRALTANAGVTLYTVESVKRNVSRWVAVDGGMSDNLRPMLYSARYEAHVADRFGGATECVLAGKHCESGDVIARGVMLDDPRPGDVIVTPATGAYGYAMASNYNGVLRPPVIFCEDGHARVVVRRETFDDLISRDVLL